MESALLEPLDAFLQDELDALKRLGLYREESGPSADTLDCCSNDYLGYARAPVSRATLEACTASAAGAGASRLIFGTRAEHLQLERELADWVRLPAALLFSSGYAANVGLLQALVARGDTVVSDALNHASIIDGCRLARAKAVVVPHRDLDACARALEGSPGRRWVLTESVFSMEGDRADLPALRALCDAHGAALIVDEAHALGVFGPEGGGLCRASSVRPDALVGTLGKALGAQGAFVAGSAPLRQLLWNRARSLVFSTASSPVLAVLALHAVRRARVDEGGRTRLHRLGALLVDRLRSAGLAVGEGATGPIVPLLVGDNAQAVALAEALRAGGFLVQAIRPPTVPRGTARLRLTVSAAHSEDQIERLSECLIRACRESSSSAPEPASARRT